MAGDIGVIREKSNRGYPNGQVGILFRGCDLKVCDDSVAITIQTDRAAGPIAEFSHLQSRLLGIVDKYLYLAFLDCNFYMEPHITIKCRFDRLLELAGVFCPQPIPGSFWERNILHGVRSPLLVGRCEVKRAEVD